MHGTGTAPARQRDFTWPEMLVLEPRLAPLEKLARHMRGDRWRNREILRRLASKLVGWDARNPLLATDRAFEIAMDHLQSVLDGGCGR